MRVEKPRAIQQGERLAHVALVEFPHEVDDVSASNKPVIVPNVLGGIDLEGRGFIPVADGAVIPQLSAALPCLRRGYTTALEVDVNRDRSGLVGAHRSKLSGKVGEGKHI